MIRVARLTGDALAAALPDVARLRIEVFRAYPYLYEGDAAYEERYLQVYRDSADAILAGAYDGARLIGAATGAPMEDHADDFGAAFAESGIALERIFYCAESVLLPAYRGNLGVTMPPFARLCGPRITRRGPTGISRWMCSGASGAMRRWQGR
jgi:hypothetical protein